MSRRIDVELTSARDDGTWTWRAAGARQPRGVVEGSVLYPGAKVGDVVRAEVETDVDGITILSVQPPKGPTPAPEGRLEIIGPPREFQAVTASLAPKRDRPPRRDRDGDRGRDRPPRPAGERGERGDRGERPSRPPRSDRDRERTGPGAGTGARTERPPRTDRPTRPSRPPRERSATPAAPERPRPKRLSPGSKHRHAMLETLSPEQRPIAEQLLRGGIPAVRRAIEDQNAQARSEGHPEIKPEPLLAIAEELLPRVKAAEWHDRADAAMADVDGIGMRDLRSVVAGADAAARDDETRALATSLREALDRRLKAERDGWIGEITTALEESRLVRALRVSTRPPDPSMRFPADLAMRLSTAASEAMAPDTPPDRWAALLEAVAASPVRTTVKPAGLPTDAGAPLLGAARQAAGRIPALAQLLGLSLPPPPTAPRRPPRPPGRPLPPRPASAPPRPPAAAAAPVDAAPPAAVPAPEPAPAVDAAADAAPSLEAAPAEPVAPAAQAEPVTPVAPVEAAPEPTPPEPVAPEPVAPEPVAAEPVAAEPERTPAPPEPTAGEDPASPAASAEGGEQV